MPRALLLLLGALLAVPARPALADEEHAYDVKTYGAAGDGVTKDTRALQAAIDACAKTGGTVRLHDGVFLSGMITLRSKVRLTIEASATLKGTQQDGDYPDTDPRTDNTQLRNCRKALIYAEGASGLAIDGAGTIDGSGGKKEWLGSSKQVPERTRPMAIFIVQSRNVTIEDVTVKDAAMWAIVNLETDDLEIKHVNVHTPFGGTRDGIDLVDCHRALVEDCTVFSEDDSICLKSGTARGVEDVTVRRNRILQSSVANALKLGTASVGGFRNVTFEDDVVEGCDKAAMAVESVDGAAVKNVVFRGITIHDAGTALFVLLGNRSGASPGSIDGVTFENIEAKRMKHSWGSVVSGVDLGGTSYPVRNLAFKNVRLTYKGKAKSVPADPPEYKGQYPDPNLWGELPAAGIFFRHVKGLVLHDVRIEVQPHDARGAVLERDVSDVTR
jgi:polygalacturonase